MYSCAQAPHQNFSDILRKLGTRTIFVPRMKAVKNGQVGITSAIISHKTPYFKKDRYMQKS